MLRVPFSVSKLCLRARTASNIVWSKQETDTKPDTHLHPANENLQNMNNITGNHIRTDFIGIFYFCRKL